MQTKLRGMKTNMNFQYWNSQLGCFVCCLPSNFLFVLDEWIHYPASVRDLKYFKKSGGQGAWIQINYSFWWNCMHRQKTGIYATTWYKCWLLILLWLTSNKFSVLSALELLRLPLDQSEGEQTWHIWGRILPILC